MLPDTGKELVTDVSGILGPIFKDKAAQVPSTASFLNVEPIGCPETSVTNYQPTLRNIAEERRRQLHHVGSLKSRIIHYSKNATSSVAQRTTGTRIRVKC